MQSHHLRGGFLGLTLMGDPQAFLLTFRTYGTWLHGDERGAVDDGHNVFGTPLLPVDDRRRDYESAILRQPPLVFSDEMREVVDDAIVDECAYRGWELMERAVRTNHVHVVVGFAGIAPEKMVQMLKARATRWLRECGLVAANRLVWVDRPGSRRYLWTHDQVKAACDYVLEGQDIPR